MILFFDFKVRSDIAYDSVISPSFTHPSLRTNILINGQRTAGRIKEIRKSPAQSIAVTAVLVPSAIYSISEVHFQQKEDGIVTRVTSTFRGKTIVTEASGNGRLDAVSNALKKAYELKYTLETYQEHALEQSSSSKAIAYVGIRKPDGTLAWGAGVDQDIIRASIDALVTAINNR